MTDTANKAASRGFLVRVSISQWTGRKMDKKATRTARDAASATDKAGIAVYKSLISADALDAIKSIATEARDQHESRTVPWAYKGPGAITVEGFGKYQTQMDELRRAFFIAVERFMAAYSEERLAARHYLGSMYDESDYPDPDQVRGRFGFQIMVEPMPVASDFARVHGIDTTALGKDLERRTNATLAAAQKDAWDRLSSHIDHMIERLKVYKPANGKGEKGEGRFHDTLVTNIRDFVALIPSLNIANDADLAALGERVERELCAYHPDALRADAAAREEVQQKAQNVLADVAAIWAARRQQHAA